MELDDLGQPFGIAGLPVVIGRGKVVVREGEGWNGEEKESEADHGRSSALGSWPDWIPGAEASFFLRQLGQYQGAGVFMGFGLRLRHLAQRKRLPFTAVFGRAFFPVLGMFFDIGTSVCHPNGTFGYGDSW